MKEGGKISKKTKKKIFISYSVENTAIVRKIDQSLSPYAEVIWWDESKELASSTWDSVSKWIDGCNFVLVILSDPEIRRAMNVGQEVGRALTREKPVFPLVRHDVKDANLGFLQTSPYLRFNPKNIWESAKGLNEILAQSDEKSPKYSESDFILGSAVIALSAFLVSGE